MRQFIQFGRILLTCVALVLLTGCGDDDKSVNGGTRATVSGMLTLPAAAEGKSFAVLIDNDLSGENGQIKMEMGTCGPGTTVSYSITGVPAGTYFVYAIVWILGEPGSEPVTGDYVGVHGADPDWPSSPTLTVPASGTVTCNITLDTYDSDDGQASATVSGTLTLPEPAPGKSFAVLIDNDLDGDNGFLRALTGFCGSGITVSYSIPNVQAGTYYAYAVVWILGNPDLAPIPGDYIGWHGVDSGWPSSPTLTVPSSGTVTCNITLGIYQ